MSEVKVTSDCFGFVYKVEVEKGQVVAKDDTLIIMEAMKMEIPLASPCAGVVKEILVREGDSLKEEQVILVLENA